MYQEYYDGKLPISIGKIAEDAYNATKGLNGNASDIANMVRDITISVGSTISSDNKTSSRYSTLCNIDGTTSYILIEMEDTPNINRDNWFNLLGLARNKHRLNVCFSVIVPLNEVANDICNELFRVDVVSKIHHLHTYMSLVHPSAENKNKTVYYYTDRKEK